MEHHGGGASGKYGHSKYGHSKYGRIVSMAIVSRHGRSRPSPADEVRHHEGRPDELPIHLVRVRAGAGARVRVRVRAKARARVGVRVRIRGPTSCASTV